MEHYDNYLGRVLDSRYRLNRIVGEGGMSIVFEATDIIMNRPVAIKMLKTDINNDEQSVKRFIAESKAVSMLAHKNIISIYDVSIKTDMKYIVMEYVDGITLKSYINKKGALSFNEVVFFSEQILQALAHAHSKNIIHRDIKPQNIILLKDGTIKVADFGIAKLPNAETVTAADKAIGTVYYISPEQASGKKIDTRSDLYSLGVVMYEMATGRLPFVAETTVTIALMQMSKTPQRPRDINPSIPVGLEQIILGALEKNPENRFSSASQMHKLIEQLKANPGMVFKTKASEQSADKNKNQGARQPERNSQQKNGSRNSKGNKRGSTSMMPVILGVTIAFLIVLVVSAILLFNAWIRDQESRSPQTITVDSYVGKILDDELIEALNKPDYYNVIIVDKYSGDYQVDEIIEQTPSAGDKRKVLAGKQYCDLTLTVCRGISTITLPDYLIREYREVEAELKSQYSLSYSEERVFSETVPAGYIIKTEPAAGEKLRTGESVKLYISKGQNIKYVKVPSFLNLTESSAYALLKTSNLEFGGVYYVLTGTEEFPEPVAQGHVVKQSKAADTTTPEKTKIVFWVSSGIKGQ